MNTKLTTSEDINAAFSGLFTNRTDDQLRDDAAQLLSFRFLSEVERLMQEQSLTRRKLAELVHTSPSYITQLFRGDRLLNINMLARFENALGVQFVIGTDHLSVIATVKNSSRTNYKPKPNPPVSAQRL